MTVIAAFSVENIPVVFGDLLITGLTPYSNVEVSLPALGDVQDFFADSGWSVLGLRQKVTLISPTCVIAWAGSFIGARLAIAELKRRSKEEPLTAKDILTYLGSEVELTSHPVSFVGFTIEGDSVYQFRFQAKHFESKSLGTVAVAGTGSLAVDEFEKLTIEGLNWISGDTFPEFTAVVKALTLGGMLLQAEFRGGDLAKTIQNMFGGGYEVALLANGQFVKVHEMTYVFWEAGLLSGKVGITMPQFVLKQIYEKDHLILRAVHFSPFKFGENPRVTKDERHVIAPMFDYMNSPVVEELSTLPLQSNLFCHCILVRDEKGFKRMFTLVNYYPRPENAKIEFIDVGGKVEIRLHRDLITEIGKYLDEMRISQI